MGGVTLKERQPSTELRRLLGVEAIGDVMKGSRLRWHGYVERKDNADYMKACTVGPRYNATVGVHDVRARCK